MAQADPRLIDVLALAGLLALGLVETVSNDNLERPWIQAGLSVGWTLALIVRRRWPLPVLAAVIALGLGLSVAEPDIGPVSYVLAVVAASFTVGRETASWWGPVLCVGFFWVIYAVSGGELSDFIFSGLLYGSPWAVGYALRQRALRIAELHDEAEDLRDRQAEREEHALAQERGRIARELHDIVSHSITVIGIQAQAVARRLRDDQEAEKADLRSIEETARQAMAEMRRLLGVLRSDGAPATLTPQPGLDQLPRLVADMRGAGVPVEVSVEGRPMPLPPGVDLTAYRVVQEALTNCRKHGGGAPARVLIRYEDHRVDLWVDDDGAANAPNGNGGYGLIGMRERVSVFGGTLQAGSRPGGGYSLHASLPVRQQAAT